MKLSGIFRASFLFCMILVLNASCKKEAEEFMNSEPVTYYLSDGASLSTNATPDGGWNYITNYIYPSSTTSCQWSTYLDHNITKGEFGYDLIFWSASETKARIEFILKEGDTEQVLASKELTIPYINETTGVQCQNDISTNPLEGINPKSGKNGELIFRITHMGGTERIEILYDAEPGYIGCTSIIVFEDK
jgi:hypothetical protein